VLREIRITTTTWRKRYGSISTEVLTGVLKCLGCAAKDHYQDEKYHWVKSRTLRRKLGSEGPDIRSGKVEIICGATMFVFRRAPVSRLNRSSQGTGGIQKPKDVKKGGRGHSPRESRGEKRKMDRASPLQTKKGSMRTQGLARSLRLETMGREESPD